MSEKVSVLVPGRTMNLRLLTPEEQEAWFKERTVPAWAATLGLRSGILYGVEECTMEGEANFPSPPSPWKCPGCGRTMRENAPPPITCPSPDCNTPNPNYQAPEWWQCAWCHWQTTYPCPCSRCSFARPHGSTWGQKDGPFLPAKETSDGAEVQ